MGNGEEILKEVRRSKIGGCVKWSYNVLTIMKKSTMKETKGSLIMLRWLNEEESVVYLYI